MPQPLTTRQIDILQTMSRGEEYAFPGKDPLDRARRKFAAMDKLKRRGLVADGGLTPSGIEALENLGNDQVAQLSALAGSRRDLAKVLRVRPESVSRWGAKLPDRYCSDAILWGQEIGREKEIRAILQA
jgi:hypothetical protein